MGVALGPAELGVPEDLLHDADPGALLLQLDAERQLSSVPPVVAGGALVLPAALLASPRGADAAEIASYARERSATERAAVDAVRAIERSLGRLPAEMPPNNKGFDIESKDAAGHLLFIEVKGRVTGADTFTVTRSEVAVGRNKAGQHILALAEVTAGAEPAASVRRDGLVQVGHRSGPLKPCLHG